MADYSPVLHLPLVAPNQNQKETTINTALAILEAASNDTLAYTLSAGTNVLNDDEFTKYFLLQFDGATGLSPLVNVEVPATPRYFAVENQSPSLLRFKVSGSIGGATVDLPSGKIGLLVSDANDLRYVVPDPVSGLGLLNDLSDVDGVPTNGQFLRYVAAENNWKPYTLSIVWDDIADAPDYQSTGNNGRLLAVKNDGSGLEWVTSAANINSFVDLDDTPNSYSGQANRTLVVNSTATGVTFATPSIRGNSDFPSSFSGAAGKYLKVNSAQTAVEFGMPKVADLTDGPGQSTFGDALWYVRVNAAGTALEYAPGSGGPVNFTELLDTPNSFSGQGLKLVRVGVDEDQLIFDDFGFLELNDTPVTYSGQAAKFAAVRANQTGLEFRAPTVQDLSNGPGAFAGNAKKVVRVNANNTALEYAALALTDLAGFPTSFGGQGGKYLQVRPDEMGVQFVASAFTTNFLALTDTPTSYAGKANQLVIVNPAASGLIFQPMPAIPVKLGDLADVEDGTGTPAQGHVLTWKDGVWQAEPPAGGGGGASNLEGLTDVHFDTPPADGQALVYRSGTGQWHAEDVGGGSSDVQDLGDLGDVDLSTGTPNAGDVLTYNDGVWTAEPGGTGSSDVHVLSDLDDVDLTTGAPTDGDVLTYKDGVWSAEPSMGGPGDGSTYVTTIEPGGFAPPEASAFPFIISDGLYSPSIVETGYGTSIKAGPGRGTTATQAVRARMKSISGSTWEFKARIRGVVGGVDFESYGLFLGRSSGSTRLLQYTFRGATDPTVEVVRMTSPTVYSASQVSRDWVPGIDWMKVVYDGTNLIFSLSADNVVWREMYREAATAWLGAVPDRVGVGVNAVSTQTLADLGVNILYYSDTTYPARVPYNIAGYNADALGEHTYWRVAPRGYPPLSGATWDIAQLTFINTVGSSVAAGGTALASSAAVGHSAADAFDGDAATYWESVGLDGQWLGYHFTTPQRIKWVQVKARNDSSFYLAPQSFAVQYSDDGVSWLDAWTVSSPNPYTSASEQTFQMPAVVRGNEGSGIIGAYAYTDLTLVNPGADTGSNTGWTVTAGTGFDVIASGATSPGTTIPSFSGPYYWHAQAGTVQEQTQVVDLTAYAALIDASECYVDCSFHVGGTFIEPDYAQVQLTCRDALNAVLDRAQTSVIEPQDGQWQQGNVSVLLPAGTRNIVVAMRATKNPTGTNINVAFDAFTLRLRHFQGELAPRDLVDLDDVEYPSGTPVTGQALVYQSGVWVPGEVSTVAALDDLTNVDLTTGTPNAGDVLTYKDGVWQAENLPASSLNALTDVTITSPAANQVLAYRDGEWRNESPAATGVPSYGSHVYWRLLLHTNNGGAKFGINEIEFRNTKTGAILSTGGTALSSSFTTGLPPSGAFDGSLSGNRWDSLTNTDGEWIGYQFTAPVEVRYVTVAGAQAEPTYSPQAFDIQWSDDGSTWTTAWSVTNQTGWAAAQLRQYHGLMDLFFTDLADAPMTYVGQGGKLLVVNSTETALEFLNSTGQGSKMLSVNSAGTAIEFTDRVADKEFFYGGKPGAGELLTRIHVMTPFRVLSSSNHGASSAVGPAASAVFSIRKNGTQFGTCTFSGGSATFSVTATNFAAGDVLSILAPGTQDANLTDVSITLKATRL